MPVGKDDPWYQLAEQAKLLLGQSISADDTIETLIDDYEFSSLPEPTAEDVKQTAIQESTLHELQQLVSS